MPAARPAYPLSRILPGTRPTLLPCGFDGEPYQGKRQNAASSSIDGADAPARGRDRRCVPTFQQGTLKGPRHSAGRRVSERQQGESG